MEKHVKIILNPSTKNCFAQIVRIVNRRKTASDTSSNHCPWGVLNNNTEKGKKTLLHKISRNPSNTMPYKDEIRFCSGTNGMLYTKIKKCLQQARLVSPLVFSDRGSAKKRSPGSE